MRDAGVTPVQFRQDTGRPQSATDFVMINSADEGSKRQQRLSVLWYEIARDKEEKEKERLYRQRCWKLIERRLCKCLVLCQLVSAVQWLVVVYTGWILNVGSADEGSESQQGLPVLWYEIARVKEEK